MLKLAHKMTLPDGTSISYMNESETGLIYSEIFEERIYERCGVHLDDNATVVDIGANVGLFLLYVTRHYNNTRIYCYEPIPETFGVLEENRALVSDDHAIELVNMGVWKEPATATFRHLPRFSCSSTMCPDDSAEQKQRALEFTLNAFDQHHNRVLARGLGTLPGFVRVALAKSLMRFYGKYEQVECRLTTVGEIIRHHDLERIDYLKVDAEGAEVEILEAIEPDHWPRIRQIVVETHRGDAMRNRVGGILAAEGFQTETSFSQSSPADQMVYGVRA